MQQRYLSQQLVEVGRGLTRELEKQAANEYDHPAKREIQAKYTELVRTKTELVKGRANQEDCYRRSYSARMNRLLPLLHEARDNTVRLE